MWAPILLHGWKSFKRNQIENSLLSSHILANCLAKNIQMKLKLFPMILKLLAVMIMMDYSVFEECLFTFGLKVVTAIMINDQLRHNQPKNIYIFVQVYGNGMTYNCGLWCLEIFCQLSARNSYLILYHSNNSSFRMDENFWGKTNHRQFTG